LGEYNVPSLKSEHFSRGEKKKHAQIKWAPASRELKKKTPKRSGQIREIGWVRVKSPTGEGGQLMVQSTAQVTRETVRGGTFEKISWGNKRGVSPAQSPTKKDPRPRSLDGARGGHPRGRFKQRQSFREKKETTTGEERRKTPTRVFKQIQVIEW